MPGQLDPSHPGYWPTDVQLQQQLVQPAAVLICFCVSVHFVLHVQNATANVTKLILVGDLEILIFPYIDGLKPPTSNNTLAWASFAVGKQTVNFSRKDLNRLKLVSWMTCIHQVQINRQYCMLFGQGNPSKDSPGAWFCSTPLHLEGPMSKKENSHGAWTT